MTSPFNDLACEVRDGLPVCVACGPSCKQFNRVSDYWCEYKDDCRGYCLLAVSRYVAIGEAARALAEKLDEIVAHPSYQAQVMIAHLHGHRYDGPKWCDELSAVKAALSYANANMEDA